MANLTLTLKLPFHRLNQVKALEFERLTAINTQVANDLLKIDKSERKKLTSADFRHIEIGSMWINQTIRNCNARTVDRGQNNIAVASLPKGFGKFWKGGRVKTLRRQFQRTRKQLQQAKQLKEVKRLEQRERRIMTHINHVISKELVQFAKDFGMGLRLEDLSGCRQTMRQRKKFKSDAASNRDSWAFYQLELFTKYKAIRAAVPVESVPAPYTSKSDHRNGVIGQRNRDWFRGFDGYRCNADWNASQNIGQWVGFSCPLHLQEAVVTMTTADTEGGVNDSPQIV